MKNVLTILMMCLCLPVLAIEGNDDNVTRDYYVQLYKSTPYIPDFETTFVNSSDRADYVKLRNYLNRKREIERVLRMAGDEYYYGLSFSRLYAEDYVQSFKDEMLVREPESKIFIRLNSSMPNIKYNGEYTVAYVLSDILPAIESRYKEAIEKDSINQFSYTRIQESLEGVQYDIFQCEQALNASLSPEFQQQTFRIWTSMTFSILIAILLFIFFFIMYRRSDRTLARNLLSETGLQFITIFVLIIAIILFGILNILGGSELAAILSGISGYILGKGGQVVQNLSQHKEVGKEAENGTEKDVKKEVVLSNDLQDEPCENKYFFGEDMCNDPVRD